MSKWISSSRIILFLLMLMALALQITLQTNGRNYWGPYISPAIWFVAGLVFSMSTLGLSARKSTTPTVNSSQWALPFHNKYIVLILGTSFLTLAIYFSYVHLNFNFQRFPVKLEGSDVIPTIEVMVKRFLAGERVYEMIKFPSHTIVPTYFSLTWLPFVPAELLHVDYRWTAVIAFLSVTLTMIYTAWWKTTNYPMWLVLAIFSAGIYFGLARYDRPNIRFSVEFLPACYYLILCISLFSRNILFIAIGITLCLLSRFSVALWLPVYAIIVWHQRGWWFAVKVGLATTAGVLLFFVIPFLGTDVSQITETLAFYSQNAPGKWHPYSWQSEGAIPHLLNQGYGLAIFFYDAFQDDIPKGVQLIRQTQLISIGVVTLFTLLYYFKNYSKNLDVKLLLLVSLNVYLLVFYSFLYAPYGYLYFVPLCTSIGLLWWLTLPEKKLKFSG